MPYNAAESVHDRGQAEALVQSLTHCIGSMDTQRSAFPQRKHPQHMIQISIRQQNS